MRYPEPIVWSRVFRGMNKVLNFRLIAVLLLSGTGLLTGGCASLISSAASGLADNLSSAMLNQDDPETVRDGAPSYLLLLDSFIEGNPDDPALLAAGASMYASYGAVFAEDPERAARLTTRARDYGLRGMCESYAAACGWSTANYDEFVSTLDGVTQKHADSLYAYGFAMLAYLRTHSTDWNALAELPQVEALFNHYMAISGSETNVATYTYMGILLTLRPPALGGKPEEARVYFEKAIQLTDGKDLSAKVEFARGYAKLLYERELHDRLLNEVLDADPYADGFTLSNVMAQEDAMILLAEADDYF
jgi:hypothetical protein